VPRGAVLVAGHSHQDEHERQPERPADKAQHDPAKAHRPVRRPTGKREFWRPHEGTDLAQIKENGSGLRRQPPARKERLPAAAPTSRTNGWSSDRH
jgi:hypothetical protein